MSHLLSNYQKAILRSKKPAWNHVTNAETQRLHRSLATCVEDTLRKKYPQQKSRDARVSLLAAYIKEFDEKVPELARALGQTDEAFCLLCAVAALGHDGEVPCEDKP